MESLLPHLFVAQINVVVGDIPGNAGRIAEAYNEAAEKGAKLVVFPEMVVSGYPPEDLVYRRDFRERCMQEAAELAKLTQGGPAMILGNIWEENGLIFNAALCLKDGQIHTVQPKQMLPNYGVFDEKRIFTRGRVSVPVEIEGVRLGVMVCEDMWFPDVPAALREAKIDAAIVINASPFEMGKQHERLARAKEAVDVMGAPLLYVNLCGGQDDLVFDGGSFYLAANGQVQHHFPQVEAVLAPVNAYAASEPEEEESVTWKALCCALGDYVNKNHFPGVLLGLSGGVDSALAATLAVDALGPERVIGVLLPSPHTSDDSNEDALQLAKNLNIRTQTLPIEPLMQAAETTLHPAMEALLAEHENWFSALEIGGNVQARLRGLLLMALSNATGHMLLSTSNKSEAAVGYTTLYGDSCGGYAPLKDLYKTQLYILAHWRNANGHVMPENSLTRAPSAELAPGQQDDDQLPGYDELDGILSAYIDSELSIEEIVAEGFDRETVEQVVRLVRRSEYKRRQMPPGAKISQMLFGRDWRYPLTNKFTGL